MLVKVRMKRVRTLFETQLGKALLGLAASPDLARKSSPRHLCGELRIRAASKAWNKRLGANLPSGWKATTQRCCCMIYHQRFSGAGKLLAPGSTFLGLGPGRYRVGYWKKLEVVSASSDLSKLKGCTSCQACKAGVGEVLQMFPSLAPALGAQLPLPFGHGWEQEIVSLLGLLQPPWK